LKKVSHSNWATEALALRTALDLTQQEFATKIGMASSTIGYWESGEVSPHKRTMARVRDICARAVAANSEAAGAAVGKRRYSQETIASLHQALDMILDNAPSEMVKDVSEYLTKRAGYYGGPPDRPESHAVPEKVKKRSPSHG